MKLYMFWTVPLSIIRSFSLYTQQWYMSYRLCHTTCEQDQDGNAVPSWSCSQAVSKPVWHTPLLCVQWKTPDDGQSNCPKHVEFSYKNKLEKLVHLVGFIIRNWVASFFCNVWRHMGEWRYRSIICSLDDMMCYQIDVPAALLAMEIPVSTE